MALFAKRRLEAGPDPEPAAPPIDEAPTQPIDANVCPRCSSQLTDPGGLGWCSGCGYCRSLEEEGKTIAPAPEATAPRKPSLLGASEFGEAMRLMPRWVWPLLGGVAFVVGVSVAADYLLPDECFARALWSAIQIVVGVVGVIVAQLWAALLVAAHEDGLRARDVIVPGRLWRDVVRRLPETRKPVWLGMWCLSGLICAVTIIAGFDYWLELVKTQRLRHIAEVAAQEKSRKSFEEAMQESIQKMMPVNITPPDAKKDLIQCVVIGYQTDGPEVGTLVLASTKGDFLYFTGVVSKGLTPEMRAELKTRLAKLTRDDSLLVGFQMTGTIWVNPGVFCEVAKSGEEFTFKRLLE